MRLIGRASAALWIAALAGLLPAAVAAAEDLGWHGDANEYGASLFYGIPQSDYAPISFSCTPDDTGLTFVFTFAPGNAADGDEVEVLLQAGDIVVPIRTIGMRMEMDDLFILEGKTVFDDRLTDLLTSVGILMVFVEDGAEEYPLEGAREAIAPLLKSCAG